MLVDLFLLYVSFQIPMEFRGWVLVD
jgi:hypothetical protein